MRAWRLLPEPGDEDDEPERWHGIRGGRRGSSAQPPGVTQDDDERAEEQLDEQREEQPAGRGTPTEESRNWPTEPPASEVERGERQCGDGARGQARRRAWCAAGRAARPRPSARRATRPPTATTTSTDPAVNHGKAPGCGSAASTGTIGSRPPSAPDHVTDAALDDPEARAGEERHGPQGQVGQRGDLGQGEHHAAEATGGDRRRRSWTPRPRTGRPGRGRRRARPPAGSRPPRGRAAGTAARRRAPRRARAGDRARRGRRATTGRRASTMASERHEQHGYDERDRGRPGRGRPR